MNGWESSGTVAREKPNAVDPIELVGYGEIFEQHGLNNTF